MTKEAEMEIQSTIIDTNEDNDVSVEMSVVPLELPPSHVNAD